MILKNVGVNELVLPHEDTGSSAGNRFNFPGGENITLLENDEAAILYDPIGGGNSRWNLLSTTAIAVTSGAVGAGTFGDTTHYPILTLDAAGRITNITAQAVTSSLTSYSCGQAAGFGLSGTYANVTSITQVVPAGTYQIVVDGYYAFTPSAGGQSITVRLFDGTAAIGNTDPTIIAQIDFTALGGQQHGTYSVRSTYVASGTVTITLQAKASSGGTAGESINGSNMFILKTG